MAITLHIQNFVLGAGRVYFAPHDSGSPKVYEGERFLGDAPGLSLTVESEKQELYDSTGPTAEKVAEYATRVTRTGSVTVRDINEDNLALFIGGTAGTQAHSAVAVTDESVGQGEALVADREYQLGISSSNQVGVKNIGSVVIRQADGTNEVQSVVVDATGGTFTITFDGQTTTALAYDANAATVQAALEALSSIGSGNVACSGTLAAGMSITFQGDLRATNVAQVTTDAGSLTGGAGTATPSTTTPGVADTTYVLDTDYELDTATGRIKVIAGGDLVGEEDVVADYTPVATTRDRVTSGDTVGVRGRLRFIGDNSVGENREVVLPDCLLTPSGELPFLSRDTWQEMGFTIEALKQATVAAIYIDGAPVAT